MIGISTSYFAARGWNIYESVKRASDLGFSLIELGANHDFEENIGETVARIRQDFPKTTFTQHCYFPPPFGKPIISNAGEGLTEENEKVLETIFKAAKILRPKIVSFHCGTNCRYRFVGEAKGVKGFKGFAKEAEISFPVASQNAKDFFHEALRRGKEEGMKIAVENMWCITGEKPLLTTPGDFTNFFQEFENLNFLLDLAHAILNTGSADPFLCLGEKIVEMHLSGIKNGRDHWSINEGLDLESLFGGIKSLPNLPILIFEHSGEVEEKEIMAEKNLVEKYFPAC